MQIVASQKLDSGEVAVGPPVMFDWKWYYHVPSLGLWAVVALLLVGLRANRQPQAWLVLVPPGLIAMVWQMPAKLVSLPAAETESFGYVVVTGALGWSVVWLLGDWLARRSGTVACLAVVGVLLAAGGLSHVLHFGPAAGQNQALLVVYSLSALVLTIAMVLMRIFSGPRFRPGRLISWQVLSIGLVAGCVLLVCVAVMILLATAVANQRSQLPFLLVQAALMTTMGTATWTILTSLFNLPFMLLAFNSPFYRKRFQAVLGLEETDEIAEPRTSKRLLGSPFRADFSARPADSIEIVGCWEFYLDELARTIVIDFRPDGTFGQSAIRNDGGREEGGDGEWHWKGQTLEVHGIVGLDGEQAAGPRAWRIAEASGRPVLCGEIGSNRIVRMSRSNCVGET